MSEKLVGHLAKESAPFCDRCGTRFVRYRGCTCQKCRDKFRTKDVGTLIKLLAIAGMIALIFMGVKSAWSTNQNLRRPVVFQNHEDHAGYETIPTRHISGGSQTDHPKNLNK